MARKTKEDAQATREGILDAAELCFHESGVARTSLEMIAAGAGVTRGAVYWHFKNKQEVLWAVVNRVRLPFMQELERVSQEGRSTPIQDLRAVIHRSLHDLTHDDRLRNTLEITLRSDLSDDTRSLLKLQQEGFAQAMDRITSVMRRAQELGQLREGVQIHAAAITVHLIMIGTVHVFSLHPQPAEAMHESLDALDIVLQSLVKGGVLDQATAEATTR